MKKIISALFFLASCSPNVFDQLSTGTGDSYYLFQAQENLDAQNYDAAITIITTKLSTSAQASVQAREVLASSYGGKCGLNFIEYVQKLASQSSGSSFQILMSPFIGVAVQPQFCRTALNTLEQIGTSANRTINQNALASILGMVLIGTALRSYADIVPALGDGTADVNICSGLTNAQVDDVIIGFGFMLNNFAAVSTSVIGGGSSTALTGVMNLCQTIAGASCQITDSAAITPSLRDTFRDLIKTSDYGIGTYSTGGNVLLIPAACP